MEKDNTYIQKLKALPDSLMWIPLAGVGMYTGLDEKTMFHIWQDSFGTAINFYYYIDSPLFTSFEGITKTGIKGFNPESFNTKYSNVIISDLKETKKVSYGLYYKISGAIYGYFLIHDFDYDIESDERKITLIPIIKSDKPYQIDYLITVPYSDENILLRKDDLIYLLSNENQTNEIDNNRPSVSDNKPFEPNNIEKAMLLELIHETDKDYKAEDILKEAKENGVSYGKILLDKLLNEKRARCGKFSQYDLAECLETNYSDLSGTNEYNFKGLSISKITKYFPTIK